MATSTKGILKSKTIWGAILALAPAVDAILPLVGVAPVLTEAAQLLLSTAGSILAIYGRVKAESKIAGVL